MPITIKTSGKDLVFSDWQSGDPGFMWFRSLLRPPAYETEHDEGAGVAIQCFDQRWIVRLYNPYLFLTIKEAYHMMYPTNPSYPTADKAKREIDKFLGRVASLKALL